VRTRRFVGTGIAFLAGQILSGERRLRAQNLFRRALSGNLTAAVAGTRTEVEQVVGGRDHFAVVFDDDKRVAEIAQAVAALRATGGCRADEGRWSARRGRNSTPVSPLPIWLARRIRCDSPPDSVGARDSASGSRDRRRRGTSSDCAPRAAVRRRRAVAPSSFSGLEEPQRFAELQGAELTEGQGAVGEREPTRSASVRSRDPAQAAHATSLTTLSSRCR